MVHTVATSSNWRMYAALALVSGVLVPLRGYLMIYSELPCDPQFYPVTFKESMRSYFSTIK
jgi:hypothetical protein